MDAPYACSKQLEPGIARVLAHNPSAFTYYGTQTYLVGDEEVAVIDPGPDLPEHVEALVEAIGGRPVVAIMCTHTHRDHSPAARPLAKRPERRSSVARRWRWRASARAPTPRSTAIMRPDRVLQRRRGIEVDGRALTAVATPGHTSNHLCFADRRCAVHRRSCDGLVDHRRGSRPTATWPPIWRASRSCGSASDRDLLSGARPAGDQPAAICARPDRPPDAAREADLAARRREAARHSRNRRQAPIRGSIRGW